MDKEFTEDVKTWDGNIVRVTNLEKTLVDMLQCEETTPGLIDELINTYRSREDTKLERLLTYGNFFNIEDLIEKKVMKE